MNPIEQLSEAAKRYALSSELGREGYVLATGFKAGALSPSAANGCNKWVEIAKIEFAIKKLYEFRNCTFGKGKDVINELEKQLENLKQQP